MGEYSVITNNRFALSVDEDEDLFELLEKEQEEKKRKEELAAEQALKAKQTQSKGKSAKSAKTNAAKRILKINDTNTQKTERSAYSRNDENRPPRFARQTRDGPSDNQNFEKPPSDMDRPAGGRGGFRGRGAPRGGFGNVRPRRDFDRHSGSDKTGVKAVEKREGSGPHNWGDEIQAQLEQPADQQTETVKEQTEEVTEDVDTADAEPVEEEPVEMTLEEYKAQLSAKANKPEFKVRKANEGADTKQWKGAVPLQRKKKGDLSEEEEEEFEYEEEVNLTKATLEKLNIQITFAESNRGGGGGGFRGGRGGRGRGFSGAPRGAPRGGRGGGFDRRGGDRSVAVPRVDNEADFPSLGAR